MQNIRNFCIIAHVDHGKSTLADRFLELTGTVDKRELRPQMLDMMPLERERGITIKLAPVRMSYKLQAKSYILNLIDTPGHADFTYEVSRSLAAVEGAVLLVDATQGVQAQTLANLHFALAEGLSIVPVINKIDLPYANVPAARDQMAQLLAVKKEEILLASAKTGEGVEKILQAVIERVPSPSGNPQGPFRALIFDSFYDEYRGVVVYVRVVDGALKKGERIRFFASGASGESLEVGYFTPKLLPQDNLNAGEIGYIVTGIKEIEKCRVGDTIVKHEIGNIKQKASPLPGYKDIQAMVFASLYPSQGKDFESLRKAMAKLKLNDASLHFEPERSQALGFGFRVGILGLLHLEIVKERLKREYNLDVTVTSPQVAYRVVLKDRTQRVITSPSDLPDPSSVDHLEEPWVLLEVVAPRKFLGSILELLSRSRGIFKDTKYLEGDRIICTAEIPLSAILKDFYDKLKSVSSGYASFHYEFLEFRPGNLKRLEILVAGETVEPFSTIVEEALAHETARRIVEKLKEILPRQLFEVKIQASIGGKIIAAERIGARRKDVTAKLYGGDVTRKMKLLEKQKKRKKEMAKGGRVEIPPEAFFEVFKV